MSKWQIIGSSLTTLQGFGLEGLKNSGSNCPYDLNILRPQELRGKIAKVAMATGLTASATVRLKEEIQTHFISERIGLVLGTQKANYLTAKEYTDRVLRGMTSPSMYSTSGYNICVGLSALAAQINGPSLVLAGSQWADCLGIATNYLQRGDVDVMMAGQVEVSDSSNWGICGLVAITNSNQRFDQMLEMTCNYLDTSEEMYNCQKADSGLEEDLLIKLPHELSHIKPSVEVYLYYSQNRCDNTLPVQELNYYGNLLTKITIKQ